MLGLLRNKQGGGQLGNEVCMKGGVFGAAGICSNDKVRTDKVAGNPTLADDFPFTSNASASCPSA
ncbi:hypothetical protein [Pseudomonas syringae pv. coryli]|uniref:hypothetical protein n=1 Tax=Pseudomonas syringae pv. coryli TaxID=317659 RepID=UPI003D2D8C70